MRCSIISSTRAIAAERSKQLAEVAGIDGRQPGCRLVRPVLPHDRAAKRDADLKRPAFAHATTRAFVV
jgi:hypothetical protein